MSWLSDLFRSHPKPTPIPVPPTPQLYDVTVEVFDGAPERDEKVPDAIVMLGSRQATTDGAGNAHLSAVPAGPYALTVGATGFRQAGVDYVVPGPPARVSLERDVPAILPLTTDRQIFRAGGRPWRWKGVSAFKLLDHFARGEDIQPYLDAYAGYNLLRMWLYVTWPGVGWEPPDHATVARFLQICRNKSWYVELTLLTDDDPARIPAAAELLAHLDLHDLPNLLIEIGNEPTSHKNINTAALRTAVEQTGFLYSSGDYEESSRFFGDFLTAHTPRDAEWPRKAHDLLEYFTGGGPSTPNDPAHHVPCVADEPPKPQDVGGNKEQDFMAYGGVCALLGAGATFHCESGKLCALPNDEERRCAAAMLAGLNAFPADAPLGGYRRIDERGGSLRTYAVGNCMVRVRPQTPDAPEPGWTPIGTEGILWKR